MERLCNVRVPAFSLFSTKFIIRRMVSATIVSSKATSNRRRVSRTLPESLVRRTRSTRELKDDELRFFRSNGVHVPVLLGEVLDVFRLPLHSFVDCTLGAAGHSSAVIQSHPEMDVFIGLDVDSSAYKTANAQLDLILNFDDLDTKEFPLKRYTFMRNFRDLKSIINQVDEKTVADGVDGILMDLGMSSMQVDNAERGFSVLNDGPLDMRMNPLASLKAEDILNSWTEGELGRVLREYGEEPNWYKLQTKIMKARLSGGLHSTTDLVNLVQGCSGALGGRQGWMKTATRVFQALRIAVNDELNTLRDALYDAFDCLAFGGRLAVISFHSLEDRIVKQTFLDIIKKDEVSSTVRRKDGCEEWGKNKIEGRFGTILTKRPITPSLDEERLNRRCRGAKLRVLQKVRQDQ